MRTRMLLLLATIVTLVPVVLDGVLGRAGHARGGGRAEASPIRTVAVADDAGTSSAPVRALAVLRRWDRSRGRAWAAGDPAALARLYLVGSATGARDVRALSRWTRRGLRVMRLRQQVAWIRVAEAGPDRLVLLVEERTVGGVAVDARRRTPVPASRWAVHRIRLVRSRGRWQVDEVRAVLSARRPGLRRPLPSRRGPGTRTPSRAAPAAPG